MAQQLSSRAHEEPALIARLQPASVALREELAQRQDAGGPQPLPSSAGGAQHIVARAHELTCRRQSAYYSVLKRTWDIVVCCLLLCMLVPVLVLVAVGIRLTDRGPLLFIQTRVGRDGRHFTIFKFRTMSSERRRRTESVAFVDRRRVHKSADDPRVTPLGRVLRRTSLDELPQIINVLRGDMSLVGPRPELPCIVDGYQTWQHARHVVRPGMTGWWQVHGRGLQPMHAHTDLDLYYIERASLRFDLHILARTLLVVARRNGAF